MTKIFLIFSASVVFLASLFLYSCSSKEEHEAEQHFHTGLELQKQGRLQEAIVEYSNAIKLAPNHAEAYYNRGLAYARKKDLDRAITDFNRAIELDPNNAKTYLLRGSAYGIKGEHEKAIVDIEKCIALSDNPSLTQSTKKLLEEVKR